MLLSTLDFCFYSGLCVFPFLKSLVNFFLSPLFIYILVNVVIPKFLQLLLNNAIRRNIVQIPTLCFNSVLIVELDSFSCCVECVVRRMCWLSVCLRTESYLIFSCQRSNNTLKMSGCWSWSNDSSLRSCWGSFGWFNFWERCYFWKRFSLKPFNSIFGWRHFSMDCSLSCLKRWKHLLFSLFFIHQG